MDDIYAREVVDLANEELSVNEPPSHPGIPNQPVPDINIQFELATFRVARGLWQ